MPDQRWFKGAAGHPPGVSMYQFKKHFTLDEARTQLPLISDDLRRIRVLKQGLEVIGFDIYAGKFKPGFHPGMDREYPIPFEQMIRIISELDEMGIQLKGLDQGLVDFPALRDNGDEVFLCWKVDEEDIEFWHDIEGGFAGRQHMDQF